MNKLLMEQLERCILLSLEKQDKMASLLGDQSGHLDLDTGVIRFNDTHECSFQVLGTESDNTLSWLWAWADEQTEIPGDLLEASLRLKAWGEQENIPEFSMPAVDLNRADGRALSLIATEVGKASCYYADHYEGGAAFVLLSCRAIDSQPSLDIAALSRHFPDVISLYELNRKNALLSYLVKKGIAYEEKGPEIVCELESGETLRAVFDDAGRMLSLNGKEI